MALTKVTANMVNPESASKTGVETIQNKTFDNTNTITIKDTNLTIQDDLDVTKQVKLQVSGLTTATTRTLTVPDANTTIVGTDAVQTLTNKTLTSPAITTPTGITKSDVGLANVDNTSDATKNAATATLTNKTLTTPVINAPTGIVKADVGLANVDNTSDATKNAATATLTNKTLTSPVINTPTGIVKGDVGLGNADNTSDVTKNAATVTLTNKTLTSPLINTPDIDGGTASNSSRITLPKAAKTTLDTLTRKQGTLLFDTTSGKPYYDDGTNLQLVGSGSGGGVNFVTNPDAESGTTGWTVDSFAAASRPSGALTGVATGVTFATSAVTPLAGQNSFILTKDAVSRQGRVVYTGITITPAYFAKVIQITADYLVNSGTFVAGSSTTDSDVIFYLQNVTDGTFIEPSSFKLLSNSTTISDRFSATFQTAAAATSYRLLMYVASTSAVAYSLKLDNISVSPSVYVYGTPVTDWETFTPTGTWSTNTTYLGRRRRVGSDTEFDIELQLAGAPNAVDLILNLGLTIDTAKISEAVQFNKALGFGYFRDISVALNGTAFSVVYETSTTVRLVGSGGGFNATLPTTWASGDRISVLFSVPTLGQSSSVQMSDQTDTRVVAAGYKTLSTTAFTAGGTLKYTSKFFDTTGAYNTTTGEFTCFVPGVFRLVTGGSFTTAATIDINVHVNGVSRITPLATMTSTLRGNGSGSVECVAGDKITLVTPGVGTAGSTDGHFFIERISGPTAIAASETVSFSANTSVTVATANVTDLVYTVIDHNTHGAYSATTGVFTAPIAGLYVFEVTIFAGATVTSATIYKNGASIITGSPTTASNYVGKNGHRMRLIAGDTVSVRAAITATMSGGAGTNTFSGGLVK